MSQTMLQHIVIIALVILGTMLTRFLPFLCFPANKPRPKYILFLGKHLPTAVFGFLVIYCLKDVSFLTGHHGIPEMAGIAVTIVVHLLFRKMLCSMLAGTLCYMLIMALW
jgi:branched-subunit amino acid transport protein AzlD